MDMRQILCVSPGHEQAACSRDVADPGATIGRKRNGLARNVLSPQASAMRVDPPRPFAPVVGRNKIVQRPQSAPQRVAPPCYGWPQICLLLQGDHAWNLLAQQTNSAGRGRQTPQDCYAWSLCLPPGRVIVVLAVKGRFVNAPVHLHSKGLHNRKVRTRKKRSRLMRVRGITRCNVTVRAGEWRRCR